MNQHFLYTVVFACTIVVTGYRLHPLTNPQHYHNEQEAHTVDDAEGCHCLVASMLLKTLVHQNHKRCSIYIFYRKISITRKSVSWMPI